jgi:glycerol-3-phosphate acyltransferase PlsY
LDTMTLPQALTCALLGYLLGAIPTGVLVGRMLRGVDPHRSGSTHTGGLNVYRTTKSLWAGVLTGLIDVGLAVAAVSLARSWFPARWAGPLAGIAAIWGHNYSVFIGLRGGVGMSTIFGAIATLSPLAAVRGLAVLGLTWLGLRRVLTHNARRTIVVIALMPALLWAMRESQEVLAVAAFGTIPIILKELADFNRAYPTGSV